MKHLKCELCNCKIKFGSKRGLKFGRLYFCSPKCLSVYLNSDIFPISDFDFETDGEDGKEETEEE